MLSSAATRKHDLSKAKMEEARRYSPGGLHSHIRRELPYEMAFKRAEGAYLWDLDGNRYIDYNAAFAATILGHCHPAVDRKVAEAVRELDLVGLVGDILVLIVVKSRRSTACGWPQESVVRR